MEGRLQRHREILGRDGLTLGECQHIGREIAKERAAIQRMAASPNVHAQVRQCRQDNQRAHGEVMDLYQRARAAGRIDHREMHRFNAIEGRLQRHREMLARDGLTMPECQHIGREIAKERAEVQRMAATANHHAQAYNPHVQQCRHDNQRMHAEVIDLFQRARAAGRISPGEAQRFNEMEGHLHRHREMLARDGLTLPECQQIGRELVRERAEVQRMAASPAHDPRVMQCRRDNQRTHAEVVDLFQRARAAGRINPGEMHRFNEMEGHLQRHREMLARDGLTLPECQQIGRELANERAAVQRMARR